MKQILLASSLLKLTLLFAGYINEVEPDFSVALAEEVIVFKIIEKKESPLKINMNNSK